MNTDPKTNNPSGAPSHPELASTDTNTPTPRRQQAPGSRTQRKAGKHAGKSKRYLATLFFTQRSIATEIIEARSLAEAQNKADLIEPEELDGFDPVDGDLWVESVELLEEGRSDE